MLAIQKSLQDSGDLPFATSPVPQTQPMSGTDIKNQYAAQPRHYRHHGNDEQESATPELADVSSLTTDTAAARMNTFTTATSGKVHVPSSPTSSAKLSPVPTHKSEK